MPTVTPNPRPATLPVRRFTYLLVGALALTGAPESIRAFADLAGGATVVGGQVSNSTSPPELSSALNRQPVEPDGSAAASYQIGFVPNRGQFVPQLR